MRLRCVIGTAVALAVLLALACSGTPPPLPGGLPPEYEAPRGYDGGAGEPVQPAPTATPAAP